MRNIYEPKFSSARTRPKTAICNVLGLQVVEEATENLNETKSISISLDASNKKCQETFLVVERYFLSC